MPIQLHFQADTAEELHQLIAGFAKAFPGQLAPAPSPSTGRVVTSPTGKPAAIMQVVNGEPEPVADPEEGAPEPGEDDIEKAPEPEAEKPKAARKAPAKAAPAKEAPAEAAKPAGDPKKVKEEAIALLQKVFSRAPVGPKAIKDLQKKFGVAKFDDVPADQVNELLAAAKDADENTKDFAS